MNKLYLVLALLFALSACSVGKNVPIHKMERNSRLMYGSYSGDKPIDLDKNNCN